MIFLEYQNSTFFSPHKAKTKESRIFGSPKVVKKFYFFPKHASSCQSLNIGPLSFCIPTYVKRVLEKNMTFLEFQKSHFFSPHKAKTKENVILGSPKVVKKLYFFQKWSKSSILVCRSFGKPFWADFNRGMAQEWCQNEGLQFDKCDALWVHRFGRNPESITFFFF